MKKLMFDEASLSEAYGLLADALQLALTSSRLDHALKRGAAFALLGETEQAVDEILKVIKLKDYSTWLQIMEALNATDDERVTENGYNTEVIGWVLDNYSHNAKTAQHAEVRLKMARLETYAAVVQAAKTVERGLLLINTDCSRTGIEINIGKQFMERMAKLLRTLIREEKYSAKGGGTRSL